MSEGSRRLPPKKEVALALLEGPSLFIHLDPRRSGVVVPKWLMGQPQLVLQVGLNMAIQIPDLTVDEEGITCTLSFNRSPFWCKLPWTAVYALVGEDGRGMIWPNDVPPEVATQMQQQKPAAAAPAAKPAKKGRKLALAEAGDGAPKSTRAKPKAAEPGPQEGELEGNAQTAERPAARPRRVPVPAPAAEPAREADGGAPDAPETPRGPRPAATPGKKPRRELPPYLRVVK